MIGVNEIKALVITGQEGDEIQYHIGKLAVDRKKDYELSMTADIVDMLYLAGYCNPHLRPLGYNEKKKRYEFSYFVKILPEKGRIERGKRNSALRSDAEKRRDLYEKPRRVARKKNSQKRSTF